MISVHMTMHPETFMDGMLLKFTVRHGSVIHNAQRHIPMLTLANHTLLDLAVDALKLELSKAITEHQRQAASVDRMRC